MIIRFRAVLIVLTISVLLLALFAATVNHRTSVHTVGPHGEYRHIQDAIANARDGDTIVVSSGTYSENITIDRRLTILGLDDGTGYPVINASGRGDAVRILAGGAYLKGFIITGSGPNGSGIRLGSSDNIIERCSVYGNDIGIYATGQNNNTLVENDIYCNSEEGVLFEGCRDSAIVSNDVHECLTGISLSRSDGNMIGQNNVSTNGLCGILVHGSSGDSIEDNVMAGDRYAIWLNGSKDCPVTGNRASGGYYNVMVAESSNCTVAGNVLENGGTSICLRLSDYNAISNNTMTGAGLSSDNDHVLALKDSRYNTIMDNTLANNPHVHNSIWLSNASYNTLTGNRDDNNGGNGLWIADGSAGNRAYLNDFPGGAEKATSGNFWSSRDKLAYSYHGKSFTGYLGNHWADYRGVDASDNGVGDTPRSGSSIVDRYPLMESSTSYHISESQAVAPEPYSGIDIGFHESVYGNGIWPVPAPEDWYQAGKDASDKFSGSSVGAVWVIGCARADGSSFLNFPSSKQYPNIVFSGSDENENYLDYFDRQGTRVFLQVEPGNANVDDLIRLVLDRYAHHPSVVGLGIDVEWYQFTSSWKGKPVSDQEAAEWYDLVSSYNRNYTLALTHWVPEKMPPTYRKGLYFLDDAYGFYSLDDMKNKFTEWGRSFPDNPVGFYIGFPGDRNWWGAYTDPYETIGQSLINNIDNLKGIYWINGQNPQT